MASDEFVVDTPIVREFVAGVQAAIAAAGSPEDAVERIRPRFAELLADPDWLPERHQAPVEGSGMGGGIGQWLLYRADDGSLSLFSLRARVGRGETFPLRLRQRACADEPQDTERANGAQDTERANGAI